jgi:hypothetical protein
MRTFTKPIPTMMTFAQRRKRIFTPKKMAHASATPLIPGDIRAVYDLLFEPLRYFASRSRYT